MGLGSIKIRGRHFATGRLCDFSLRDGRIESVQSVSSEEVDPDEGLWIAPGLIDLQVNGYGGHDFLSGDVTPEDVLAVAKALLRFGVTAFCPTVTTNSFRAMETGLKAVNQACVSYEAANQRILGIHLEGPYLSPEDGPRGAHPPEHVRMPDWDEFTKLQEAAGGRIRLITMAPELPGSLEFIQRATAAGVRVALGHHAASPEQIDAAVNAGAVLSTHLGNGMHAQLDRHHNSLWQQLADDRLMASIIVDGRHLPAALVKVFCRAKEPSRLILVSDLLAVAGLAPGRYHSMDMEIELCANGFVRLVNTPYLAGSTVGLEQAIGVMMHLGGVSFKQAVIMASLNPASLLDETPLRGTLEVGARADLTVFRKVGTEYCLVKTLIGGCCGFRAEKSQVY